MKALLKKSITLALFSTAAAIVTLAAEIEEAGDQRSHVGSETQMQEAMSEFHEWRQENSERGTSASSGGVDWSSYTSDNGWSTGLSRDSGSQRMVSGLSSGSILGSQSIVKHSVSSSSGTGNKALDRPSPASSIISEFSQIGRGESSSSISAGSRAHSSAFTRAGSSASEQQSTSSLRSSGSSSSSSAASTSRAATSPAATTAPDQFTPSQPRRTRSGTPSYLGH